MSSGAGDDRILPEEVADGAVPDADFATEDGQLGGENDAVDDTETLLDPHVPDAPERSAGPTLLPPSEP